MKLDQYLVKIYIKKIIFFILLNSIKSFTVQISDPIEVEHDQEVHEQHLKRYNK
jgi:hypothetical protein